jgi:undecaprenyl-diphosphatase
MTKDGKIILLGIVALIMLMAIGINIKGSADGILFDEKIMQYVHERATTQGIEFMKKITFFGSAKFFLGFGFIVLLYMIMRRNREGVVLLMLSTIGSYGVNFILKHIFTRTRPIKYFLIEQGGYSFPSGHAMISMSFYTTMTYLIIKSSREKGSKDKKVLWILNFLIVGFIGFSRIYLGIHWPTDVLMGYLMGYVVYKTSVNYMI